MPSEPGKLSGFRGTPVVTIEPQWFLIKPTDPHFSIQTFGFVLFFCYFISNASSGTSMFLFHGNSDSDLSAWS